MSKKFVIHTDGACRGNPGPASIGVVIHHNDELVCELAEVIGQATNNIAEYTALIYGLQKALVLKADEVDCFTDSELMYRQIIGQYKVKNDQLKRLLGQVNELRSGFKKFHIQHVLRDFNQQADRLASDVLKKQQVQAVASVSDDIGEESPSSKG